MARLIERYSLLAVLAADYRASDRESVKFFQIVQNKLHFADTGQTAPELISGRADHIKANVGLTMRKGSQVQKTDVTIANNYLNHDEISELSRIVVMWLYFAEDQAKRRRQVFLRDWETKLNEFLQFNERRVLRDAGRVSKARADQLAVEQYEQFSARRRTFLEAEAERELGAALEEETSRLLQKATRKRTS